MKTKTKIILILITLFVADFLCYKFTGYGIINGNLLIVDISFSLIPINYI